jgi:hypothetical protein
LFARVIRFEGVSAAEWEVGDGWFREDFVPRALDTEGFEGAYLLVDHDRGTVLTVTLWTDEHALEASSGAVKKFLAPYTPFSGPEPVIETFEIAHAELRRGIPRS